MQISINSPSDYIIFIYFLYLQNVKLIKDQVMSSINGLNSSFCILKKYIKYEFINKLINNIQIDMKIVIHVKNI